MNKLNSQYTITKDDIEQLHTGKLDVIKEIKSASFDAHRNEVEEELNRILKTYIDVHYKGNLCKAMVNISIVKYEISGMLEIFDSDDTVIATAYPATISQKSEEHSTKFCVTSNLYNPFNY